MISEFDYTATPMMNRLGVAPRDARLFMVAGKRWKLVHPEGGFAPMLFDMEQDPNEFHDLGQSPEHEEVRAMMYDRLAHWARRLSQRTALSDDEVRAMTGKSVRKGILLGLYDGSEVDPELLVKLKGKAQARYA